MMISGVVVLLLLMVTLQIVFLYTSTHHTNSISNLEAHNKNLINNNIDTMYSYENSLVPCGDKILHHVMVQYISEIESQYLYKSMNQKKNLPEEMPFDTEVHRKVNDIIRRVYISRLNRKQQFNTVHIGAHNGIANDPIYLSLLRPHKNISLVPSRVPQYSLRNWDHVAVEGSHVAALTRHYGKFISNSDMREDHIHLIGKVVTTPDKINNGKCDYYSVVFSKNCALRSYLTQLDATTDIYLKDEFHKHNDTDFESCVQKSQRKCITLSSALKMGGFDLILNEKSFKSDLNNHQALRRKSNAELSMDKYCISNAEHSYKSFNAHTNSSKTHIDILIVDVSGEEESILKMIFEELCSALYPSVLIYNDQTLRNYQVSHEGTSTLADDLIVYLESKGYYVLISGVDVIALRVGYSVNDLRHVPYPNLYYNHKWLHSEHNRISTRSDW